MKTFTIKLPEHVLSWLEREAKKSNQPKSAVVRDLLERAQQTQRKSALDLASDLCGSVESGVPDLSRNKAYFKGFGR